MQYIIYNFKQRCGGNDHDFQGKKKKKLCMSTIC